MKFFIDGNLITADDMPLIVVLNDQDKEYIANMPPEANVYCVYEDTEAEVENLMTEAKELDKNETSSSPRPKN